MTDEQETRAPAPRGDRTVIRASLFRTRAERVAFSSAPPAPKPEPVRRPAKVARLLALAHHLQAAIDRGLVADRAEVARKLGVTRARVSQLLDLTLLAPDIQAELLAMEALDGLEPMSERTLRAVARSQVWSRQRVVHYGGRGRADASQLPSGPPGGSVV